MRHILTGSLDHTYRLYMSNLVSSPICPHCNVCDETAEHIFWYCSRWDSIRHEYSTLLRLFSLVGTQWPKCFLHCGWIELFCDYGISFLFDLGITYSVQNLVHDTHRMFLKIILARHTASQVLRSTPLTPPNHPTPPSSPHTILSSPSSCVQLPGDVSPLSLMYSPGSYNPLSPSFESQKNIYLKYVDTKHIFGKAWKNLWPTCLILVGHKKWSFLGSGTTQFFKGFSWRIFVSCWIPWSDQNQKPCRSESDEKAVSIDLYERLVDYKPLHFGITERYVELESSLCAC